MLRCQIDNCDERGTAETNLPIGDTSLMARGVWVCSKHYEILIAKSKPSGGEESGSGIKTDGGNRLGLPKSEPGRPASKPPEGLMHDWKTLEVRFDENDRPEDTVTIEEAVTVEVDLLAKLEMANKAILRETKRADENYDYNTRLGGMGKARDHIAALEAKLVRALCELEYGRGFIPVAKARIATFEKAIWERGMHINETGKLVNNKPWTEEEMGIKPSSGEQSGAPANHRAVHTPVAGTTGTGQSASKPPEGKPRKCNTCPHTNKPIYEVPCRRCKTRTNDETDKDEWRQDPNKPDQGYIEGRISPD
jgi:hypothetical protein